jgi:hypothetical protein
LFLKKIENIFLAHGKICSFTGKKPYDIMKKKNAKVKKFFFHTLYQKSRKERHMKPIHSYPMSRHAQILLRICLGLTLLSSIALLISYLDARATAPLRAAMEHLPMLEYIFAALTITACGFVLLCFVEREQNQ